MSQPLSNDTLRFCERLRIDTGNAIFLNVTRSSDGVHFQLNGYTSHSNTRTAKGAEGFDNKHFLICLIQRHLVTQFSVANDNRQIFRVCRTIYESYIELRST
jgi:hypothetical protein